MADMTRRDALARNIAARLCADRRNERELEAIDAMLATFEREEPTPDLEAQLERDMFIEQPELGEVENAKRRGWNLGVRHALSVMRAHRGLTELRRQTSWPAEEVPQ